jgi:hypothetical protein
VAFGPTARHIGEDRQDRQFIIVIPKNERIMPEKDEAEEDNNQTGTDCAENFRTRGAWSGHLRKKTPNVQRPTLNIELRRAAIIWHSFQPS